MKIRILVNTVILFTLSLAAHSAAPRPTPLIDVNVDRSDGIYRAGEDAVFTLTTSRALPPEGVTVRYVFMRDGITTESAGSFLLKSGPFQIKRTLFRPGWLRCQLYWNTPTTGTSAVGVLFNPLKIRPARPEPADFDAFWAKQKASLAGDYTAEVTPLPSQTPGVDLYHVKIPMPDGTFVQGYMTKPHGAAPRSLGAIAYPHGAAVPMISSRIPNCPFNMIAFDFNAHGHDDAMSKEFYKHLSDTTLKQYWLQGWESRDTCYFLGMFKRLMRAVDFLTRQPEWDGKVLVVYGGSQGGAQAIAAAGLDPRVSCIVAGIPAMCDLSGWAAGRIDGWPHAIKTDRDGRPLNPKIAATVPYFDNDYFARRVKCDALFTTGLIDRTCHPCTVMAAYNSLGSRNKELLTFPKYSHVFGGDKISNDTAEQFVRESVARVKGQ